MKTRFLPFIVLALFLTPLVLGAQIPHQPPGDGDGGDNIPGGGEDSDGSEETSQEDDEDEEESSTTTDPEGEDDGEEEVEPVGENIRPAENLSSEERSQSRAVVDDRGSQPLEERGLDTDSDGVIDYDEINIYGTDPENPDTSGNGITDGEMIETGLDPTSTSTQPISYEDPREVPTESFSGDYTVSSIEVTTNNSGQEVLRLEGRGQSHQYLSVYIFSTPVVVTVRTDGAGRWEYEYSEELADGDHEVYVASVDNSGRIMARSDAVPFSRDAAAISIGQSQSAELEPVGQSVGGFFVKNWILISVFAFLFVLMVSVVMMGIRSKNEANLKS